RTCKIVERHTSDAVDGGKVHCDEYTILERLSVGIPGYDFRILVHMRRLLVLPDSSPLHRRREERSDDRVRERISAEEKREVPAFAGYSSGLRSGCSPRSSFSASCSPSEIASNHEYGPSQKLSKYFCAIR